jgi:hypothetical protein
MLAYLLIGLFVVAGIALAWWTGLLMRRRGR